MTKSKTDLELKETVMDELRWDSRVDEAGVGVSVKDEIVMLTGTVSGYAQKLAAQEAAHRVAGASGRGGNDEAHDFLWPFYVSRRRRLCCGAGRRCEHRDKQEG